MFWLPTLQRRHTETQLSSLAEIALPGILVCMDKVWPWPNTFSGYRYVITIVDSCSQYPIAIPNKQTKTEDVEKVLLRSIEEIGTPTSILIDSGLVFNTKWLKIMGNRLKIKLHTTAPYAQKSA